jgi:radical SAM-linked protein
MLKVIVKYEKMGYSKYLGHLEMVTQIERILRRLDLPLEYSKGYNPRPQISFAAPLAVGVASVGEYFEAKITEEFDLERLTKIDESFLPKGIKFVDAEFSTNSKSIMALVKSSTYIVCSKTEKTYEEDSIREKVKEFLQQSEVNWVKIRKKKKPITKNIIGLINNVLVMNTSNDEIIFRVDVKTGSAGNLKPEIVLEKFSEFADINLLNDVEIQRLEIFKEKENKLVPII